MYISCVDVKLMMMMLNGPTGFQISSCLANKKVNNWVKNLLMIMIIIKKSIH